MGTGIAQWQPRVRHRSQVDGCIDVCRLWLLVPLGRFSDELFLHFSSKVQNLTVFSIIYMIRIRFFGLGELIKRYFSGGTVRGDALVAAQEVGFDNLCDIVDGTLRGIDTLINHMRGMVFPLTEHEESEELLCQYCRPGGLLFRQSGGSLTQYVSRRRRCWTLLVPMDPTTHFSEGHRKDMLLDRSGLTREERVVAKASNNNERDFDRVAEALIPQHPRIRFRESQKRAKGKGKDGFKRGDNSNVCWLRGKKARVNTLALENLEDQVPVPIKRVTHPLKIMIMMTTRLNPQMPTKHTMILLTSGVMTEKKFFMMMMMMRKMKRFLRMLLWMMSLLWRQLN